MNGGSKNHELQNIYETMTTCSNTRSLILKIAQGGCVVNFENRLSFDFRPGDRFPALHELHLDGYRFNEYLPEWQNEALDVWYDLRRFAANWLGLEALRPTLRLDRGRLPGANLEKWKAAMDWAEIKDLDLEDVESLFLESMRGELPGLESLRLGPLQWESCQSDRNVTYFLSQLNPLTRLSLHGYTDRVNWTQILDRHGSTLNTLEVREWESSYGWEQRPTLDQQQLQQISQMCPSLSKLGLDINRNGTWPFEILDSLAANERLDTLELFFELGMDQHQDDNYKMYGRPENRKADYRQPDLNRSSSLELFKRLRGLKKGVELQRMTLHMGDIDRDYGHMMRFPMWGEHLSETYECDVLDSKGQRKWGEMVWCTGEPRNMGGGFESIDEEDEGDTYLEEEELRLLSQQLGI